MNWDAIGGVGEWAGAIAVFATLVHLARQIEQSNNLGKADAEREWFDGWHEVHRSMGSDLETGDLIQRGLKDYLSLKAAEKAVFHTRIASIFNQTQLAILLRDKGLLSDELTEAMMDLCVGVLLCRGGNDWWEDTGLSFTMLYEPIEAWRRRTDREFTSIERLGPWRTDDA